jgi:hypothetical protein
VLPVQRVLDQVLPKLPGRTDDADPHATLPLLDSSLAASTE